MRKLLKSFGDSMRLMARDGNRRGPVRKDMGENTGASGGYTVPEELFLQFDEALKEVGIFHQLAWTQPMARKELNFPGLDVSFAHATGNSPLYGGFTAAWTLEATEPAETDPKFANSQLVANELEAVVTVSNQLVEDGGEALGAFLFNMFKYALEWTVELACFNGSGLGKPTGIVSSPATATVTRSSASHVTQTDISKMVRTLLPACFPGAIWCAHPTAIEDICGLSTYHVNPAVSDFGALCGQIMGRPLYATEKLPAIGNRGDVMLFYPKLYLLGSHELEISVSRHSKFLTNQTDYRAIWRGDGKPIPRSTITLQDGATVCAAFVALL